MRRNTYTGVLGVTAQCYDCGWHSEARNGLGTAARHADAHPDHEVSVEQTIGITYNRKERGGTMRNLPTPDEDKIMESDELDKLADKIN